MLFKLRRDTGHALSQLRRRYKGLEVDESFIPALIEHIELWKGVSEDKVRIKYRNRWDSDRMVCRVQFRGRTIELVYRESEKVIITFFEDPIPRGK